jgi:ribosomal protein L11 methyltransferase
VDWLQLHIVTRREQAFLAELLLEGLEAVSITQADAEDHPVLEPDPGQIELWPFTRTTGLFAGDSDAGALREAAEQRLDPGVIRELSIEPLADQVWERAWLEHFHPMRFGERLWIRPSGSQINEPDSIIIDLDPGLAFGTGTHPTTALCLRWLDGHPPKGQQVMDYGCGSGILAIAALKLGASQAIAIDHDPQALEATRDNGRNNGVDSALTLLHTKEDCVAQVELVMANILSHILISLEERLAAHLPSGGQIILSGILESQADSVSERFSRHFTIDPPETLDGWVLLHGVKK